MLAFVITVDQVSAYLVALFRRAMLLLHVVSLFSAKGDQVRLLGLCTCFPLDHKETSFTTAGGDVEQGRT
jgi:hypothetical protein